MTVAGILIGVAVALAVPSLRDAVGDAIHGNTAQVRHDLGDSAAGPLLVLWLSMVHVIVWYPAEILDAAAGYVFGFGVGLPAGDGLLDPLGARLLRRGQALRQAAPLPRGRRGALPARRGLGQSRWGRSS